LSGLCFIEQVGVSVVVPLLVVERQIVGDAEGGIVEGVSSSAPSFPHESNADRHAQRVERRTSVRF
jgi:hypothetical protein